jgi:hypothetical protein
MASNPPVTPPPPPPAYPQPPAQPQVAPPITPQPKKTSPWVWVLVGCGGFIVLLLIIFALLGVWGYRKAKQIVGAKNPAVATARLVASANPDLEVVSSDDDAGTITLRNKKTGETLTMNADDIKNGHLKFTDEKGQEVTIEAKGHGDTGSVSIKSNKGEMKFGAGEAAEVPDWVPSYPGAKSEGVFSGQTEEGSSGTVAVETTDSPSKVMAWYRDRLDRDGFEVNTTTFEKNGRSAGGSLTAEAKHKHRTVNVVVSVEGGKTKVAVTFGQKQKNGDKD